MASLPKYLEIVEDGYTVDEEGGKWAKFKIRIKWWGVPIIYVRKIWNRIKGV